MISDVGKVNKSEKMETFILENEKTHLLNQLILKNNLKVHKIVQLVKLVVILPISEKI